MTVIRCVEARRDEGKKAVSVMCVIVYVDTSFHPALSCWKKGHNLENENSSFFCYPHLVHLQRRKDEKVYRNGNERNP